MNNKKYNILDFYKFDESFFKKRLFGVFNNQKWIIAFNNNDHHGFTHGNQVRLGSLKLVEKLTTSEKKTFKNEGNKISAEFSHKSAVAVIQLCAIFHDCGRYNINGNVIANEQKQHHLLSLKRAIEFCKIISQKSITPYIKDAIISHDYQSKKLTPHLNPPKTIIGKIIQSSDQLGWFHPESIQRTIKFNETLGLPFFDKNISIEKRLNWKPGKHNVDAITVMLHQLFGPTKNDRFGISEARKKIETYKKLLKNNILKESKRRGVQNEVEFLIKDFSKQKK